MYRIGIDLGGTNIAVGLVNEEHKIIIKKSTPTLANREPEAIVADMARLCLEVCADQNVDIKDIANIGIATPGIANPVNGCVEYTNNLPFRRFPIVDILANDLGIDRSVVKIANDANAAAWGEAVAGAAKGSNSSIMVTLGTGVGSGFVANGEMIYGHDGFAGEFGHVIVERGGRECGCGRKGCLETYTSAGGIKRTAFELMATMTDPSPLREYSFDQLEAAMLSQFAAKGDPIAKECFRLTGQKLGYALADAVTITSPEAIFIFGGLAKAGDLIFDPIKWYMEENMLIAFKNKVKVLPSELQNKNAAVLGASALVWQATK